MCVVFFYTRLPFLMTTLLNDQTVQRPHLMVHRLCCFDNSVIGLYSTEMDISCILTAGYFVIDSHRIILSLASEAPDFHGVSASRTH